MTTRVSIVNFSSALADDEVMEAVRVVNRQVMEDVRPRWQLSAQLFFSSASGGAPAPDLLVDDAAIFVCDTPEGQNIGFHQANALDIPYGFVFTELAHQLGQPWTITLSHEVIEMIVDPQVNQLVVGPHPTEPTRSVPFLKEVCDPVQADSYVIDGTAVANFVTPAYYAVGSSPRSTNQCARDLAPFGVLHGGYVQYLDDQIGALRTFGPAAMRAWNHKEKYLGNLRRQRRHLAVSNISATHERTPREQRARPDRLSGGSPRRRGAKRARPK
ncbi:MAG TPA: hypothetical protein VN253_05065 [Kofleriaceae bacterium]|nr:hypothetical protein [Kofleriaceae bacterium]